MNAHIIRRLCALVLACAGGGPQAAPAAPPSLYFSHRDWEIACDNTRTCRAAGYQGDEADSSTVSVLLTRAAGPASPVQGRLQLGSSDDEPAPGKQASRLVLAMSVNGQRLGSVTIDSDTLQADLTPPQTKALLDALPRRSDIQWTAKGRTWRLSDQGAAAVLLKMDEFQGRIGTPGALIRKGSRTEHGVLPPLPVPVVQAVAIPPQRAGQKLLPPQALHQLKRQLHGKPEDDNCSNPEEEDDIGDTELAVVRLSRTKLLVSRACWRAAYNEGIGYWIVNDKPPFQPVLVTEMGTDFSDGRIHSSQKGRGMGDCWSHEAWTWDGQAFVHTEAGTTGLCKMIAAGGAWSLPTLVTQVRPPAP